MAEFTIYIGNKNYSSWSLRPWLALRHTGAAFEEVMITLDQPDSAANLRRRSPSGRVPVLQHGALAIWESLAICEYLAEQFPAARLWPEEREARARARAVSNEMHGGFAALRDHLPMDINRRWPLGNRLAKAGPDVERVTAIWRECRVRFGERGADRSPPIWACPEEGKMVRIRARGDASDPCLTPWRCGGTQRAPFDEGDN